MIKVNRTLIFISLILSLVVLFSSCENEIENEKTKETAGTETEEENVSEDTVSETDLSYESLIFDTSYVHEISIEMSESDFNALCESPTDKIKYPADITIDGETFKNVAVSTKGNFTLKTASKDENRDRYSLKIVFDKYEDGQLYHGLDVLNLNNNLTDFTYMRDYLASFMFRFMGVPSYLASYANISVNGSPYGFFSVLEEVDESFLERNFLGEGELYKPESSKTAMKSTATDVTYISGGADLAYSDDEFESYGEIFDHSVKKCSDNDKKKVIKALKNISEGNLDDAVYKELLLKYFTVHNFVLNADSYTNKRNGFNHNYYLYENDGLLTMIPWDYNGGFNLGNAAGGVDNAFSVIPDAAMKKSGNGKSTKGFDSNNSQEDTSAGFFINKGIDTPLFSESKDGVRPMWENVIANEEYKALYHQYFDEFIKEFFESGRFESEFTRVRDMIRPYVETDPSAYATLEGFDAETKKLYDICTLRAESIRKQLDGGLSTVSGEQDKTEWVDASALEDEE